MSLCVSIAGEVGWLAHRSLLFSCPMDSESVLAQQFSHRGSRCALLCCDVSLLDKMSQEELSVFREVAKLSREPH